MEIKGYKCFNKDFTNRYGVKFSAGQIYVAPGIIKFGNNGNGFHLCKNIEDTFRYIDTTNFVVCEVIGSGNYVEYFDEYNGYYDMYSVEKIEIIKELSREELIDMGLNLHPIRAQRFLSTLKLTEEEINIFKTKFNNNRNIMNIIAYYQEGKEDIYNKKQLTK